MLCSASDGRPLYPLRSRHKFGRLHVTYGQTTGAQAAGALTKLSTVKHCFHLLLEQDLFWGRQSACSQSRQLTASCAWP